MTLRRVKANRAAVIQMIQVAVQAQNRLPFFYGIDGTTTEVGKDGKFAWEIENELECQQRL